MVSRKDAKAPSVEFGVCGGAVVEFVGRPNMSDIRSLLADISKLSVDERVQLIEALWDTVPQDAMPPLSDEWLAEIARRSAEYDSGSVTPISRGARSGGIVA